MIIQALVSILGIYAALGLLFAIAFVSRGVDKIDPNADGAPIGFRLLILPGSVAFWPLLALRWKTASPPPEEKNAHRCAVEDCR